MPFRLRKTGGGSALQSGITLQGASGVDIIGSGSATKETVSVHTASGTFSGSPSDVSDGSDATTWAGDAGSAWVKLDLGSSVACTHMLLQVGNANNWKLDASNDDINWEVIESSYMSTNGPTYYQFGEAKNYRYWRLGNTGGSWPSCQRFELYQSYTGDNPGGIATRVWETNYSDRIVDGDTNTFWQNDGAAGWGGICYDVPEELTELQITLGTTSTRDVEATNDPTGTWTTIAASVSFTDNVEKLVTVSTSVKYRWWRLSGGTWWQIREMSGSIFGAGVDVDLSGDGHAAADGAADLTVEVQLSGDGQAAADSSASLTGQRLLAGGGDAAADSSAWMATGADLDLAGSGDAVADGAAVLGIDVFLSGDGQASSEGSGDLTTSLAFSGAGDVAADGAADLTVGETLLSGSGHMASDGSSALTVKIKLIVDISLPAMSSPHNLLRATPQVLVGGLILPSYVPTASAISAQRTGLIEPTKYIPKFFNHQRQVVGLDGVGPLTLVPLSVPETRPNAFEIHLFSLEWISTPHHDDFHVNSELDIRWVGKNIQWRSGVGRVLVSKDQGSGVGQSDGEWIFYVDGTFDSGTGLPIFTWWDTTNTKRIATGNIVPVDNTCRAGIRVNFKVGGGSTTVTFYWATNGSNWQVHDTVNFGSEYPIRQTTDHIEIGSHNNGDSSQDFYNPPIPFEGTVQSLQIRVDGNSTPVANMQASNFLAGIAPNPDVQTLTFNESVIEGSKGVDASGKVWTLEKYSDWGQFETIIHTHSATDYYHNPFFAWYPRPSDDDFGTGNEC